MAPAATSAAAATLHFGAHLGGSATAAIVNFPLWKAAAIGQSGFKEAAHFIDRMRLIFGPPYKGVAATIFGMTWARAAIFYGSDTGKEHLTQLGFSSAVASTVPPVSVSAAVQVINQPIMRATIQLQDPVSTQPNVLAQLVHLSEPCLLHTLGCRYSEGAIYSYTGTILIALNPWRELLSLYSEEQLARYRDQPLGSMPPHLFAVADSAFRGMRQASRCPPPLRPRLARPSSPLP